MLADAPHSKALTSSAKTIGNRTVGSIKVLFDDLLPVSSSFLNLTIKEFLECKGVIFAVEIMPPVRLGDGFLDRHCMVWSQRLALCLVKCP